MIIMRLKLIKKKEDHNNDKIEKTIIMIIRMKQKMIRKRLKEVEEEDQNGGFVIQL